MNTTIDSSEIGTMFNPLHKLCLNPFVTTGSIQQCIQQNHCNEAARATTKDMPRFTPLHLLSANPSVPGQLITSYLQLLAPDIAIMEDNNGATSLHMLCSGLYFPDNQVAQLEPTLKNVLKGREQHSCRMIKE